ncbi:hypothetical protein BJY16_003559 [Actinoplanes octamycinicus]|uniref:Uncharacterized protein n=1 Tax=Actinoplanes octamycinicus TaxID=135948 RepID=A0A7W7M7S2_9ACTN|nr:hypothetical protein [Actinoplanes octamycinicus]MBB4740100.1 hypothetical protein [Actinoplanes octamycinicus]GIE59497.1 hypothetical protein Aoc01nite_48990 [Actinoplanes octamycinicus]
MRGIVRTGLIGCVVLGSVTVADEARARPGSGEPVRAVRWTVDGAHRPPLLGDLRGGR